MRATSRSIFPPPIQNLRVLQGGDELSALLEALKNKQAQLAAAHGKYVPAGGQNRAGFG